MAERNIEGIHPLTPLQEGILFECLDATNRGAYFNQFTCRFNTAIDTDALQQAWQLITDRHAVLRTLFTWEKRDKPLQIVRHRVDMPWQVLDWQDLPDAEQAQRLATFLQEDRERGIALGVAPLMRIALVRLGRQRWRLIWSFHHIVLDGWSLRLLLDEVRIVYAAALSGQPHGLPPAPDYFAFVDRQAQRNTAADEEFWRARLAGFTAPTAPDFGRGDSQDPAAGPGQMTELGLGQGLSERIRALARQHRVTLNTVCAAAWSLLLARYCDSRDVVFGRTVAGRSDDIEGIEKTAGLFINTLPLRTRLEKDLSLHELLRSIQAEQVAQQPLEQTPLTSIHRASELSPRTPLFESILVFENLRESTDDAAARLAIDDAQFIEYSNFPLALLVVPGKSLQLIAVHDSRRYSHAAVERLLQHYLRLLSGFADDPQRAVYTVPMLTDEESRLQLVDWNNTGRSFDAGDSVVSLFEHCAARNPDSVAVSGESETLTYEQLNRRANRLAHFMSAHVPVLGTPVVIFADRSEAAITAMLATLKAGACYVPVDPGDGGERLADIITDLRRAWSGTEEFRPLVLTRQHLAEKVPDDGVLKLLLEDVAPEAAESNPGVALADDTLAYIIYTSGSTGTPKGVMIPHRALANSTLARREFYPEPVGAFALLSSLATDSSIAGIYWTLCGGGNLVLPGHRSELDIAQLGDLFQQYGVTHTLCVPSLYDLILRYAPATMLRTLMTVVIAGEAGSRDLVRRHFDSLPGTSLVNEYGPSEACVWASAVRLEPEDAVRGLTIGGPIANTRLYILDSAGQALPIGIAGELVIGGRNVSSGYLGRDEQTAASFIPDSFSDSGVRLYRTGDKARFRDDGRVEFLGRIDEQLKVRGYRVEPGEIEAILVAHPDVESAAVFLDESTPPDGELQSLIEEAGDAVFADLLAEIEALEDQSVLDELAAAGEA